MDYSAIPAGALEQKWAVKGAYGRGVMGSFLKNLYFEIRFNQDSTHFCVTIDMENFQNLAIGQTSVKLLLQRQ